MEKVTVTKEYKRADGTKIVRDYTGVNPNATTEQIKAAFDALDGLSTNTKLKTRRVTDEELD